MYAYMYVCKFVRTYMPTYIHTVYIQYLYIYKDGDLLACDCKDKFSKFVYKQHGHVHTGDLELIENVPLRNIVKMEAKFREMPPIYTEMLLNSSQKSSSFY